MTRFVVVPPPMTRVTPARPSLPIMAISVEAPSVADVQQRNDRRGWKIGVFEPRIRFAERLAGRRIERQKVPPQAVPFGFRKRPQQLVLQCKAVGSGSRHSREIFLLHLDQGRGGPWPDPYAKTGSPPVFTARDAGQSPAIHRAARGSGLAVRRVADLQRRVYVIDMTAIVAHPRARP